MRHIILAALVCVAAPVGAQAVYRCGNTFSQQPCGPGATVPESHQPRPGTFITAPPLDAPASPEVVAAAKAACAARLRQDVEFKDPDSVKVLGIERAGFVPVPNGEARLRVYLMRVNAKNSYGGYVGPKDYLCYVDRADERLAVLVRQAAYER